MAILASLTAVAVSGTVGKSKSATKSADEDTVTEAAQAYAADHPQERYPTLDGCLPGDEYKSSSKTCVSSADGPAQVFTADETVFDLDLNLDGDKTDLLVTLVPIIWNQAFTGDDDDETLTFRNDFIKLPSHGFEDRDGDSFKSTASVRTEDSFTLEGVPTISDCTDTSSGDCPVWVFNEFGDAIALLESGAY